MHNTFERPYALVLGRDLPLRNGLVQALSSRGACTALGAGAMSLASEIAQGVLLSAVVIDASFADDLHETVAALRAKAGAARALFVLVLGPDAAGAKAPEVDLVLSGSLRPNVLARSIRVAVDQKSHGQNVISLVSLRH